MTHIFMMFAFEPRTNSVIAAARGSRNVRASSRPSYFPTEKPPSISKAVPLTNAASSLAI